MYERWEIILWFSCILVLYSGEKKFAIHRRRFLCVIYIHSNKKKIKYIVRNPSS